MDIFHRLLESLAREIPDLGVEAIAQNHVEGPGAPGVHAAEEPDGGFYLAFLRPDRFQVQELVPAFTPQACENVPVMALGAGLFPSFFFRATSRSWWMPESRASNSRTSRSPSLH